MKKLPLTNFTGTAYVAADADEYESQVNVPQYEIIHSRYLAKRNLYFHRKVMALIRLVFKNQDIYSTMDAFREEFLVRCEHFETHVHLDKSTSLHARSMAFDAIDDDRLKEIFDKGIDIAIKYFMQDEDKKHLVTTVLKFLG